MRPDFQREKRWWDAKAPGEQHDIDDEAINRVLAFYS